MGCNSSAPPPYSPPPPGAPYVAGPATVVGGGAPLCPCGNVSASMCGSVPRKCALCCSGPCVRHGVAMGIAVGAAAVVDSMAASIAPSAGGSSSAGPRGRMPSQPTKDMLKAEMDDRSVRIRKPCKYGLKCFRRSDQHLSEYSHPDDDDYVRSIRKHNAKAEFSTLKQCFLFCDPYQKGIIDDQDLMEELITKHLQLPISTEEAWKELDDDGNGYASFPEFAEWAMNLGDRWPGGPLPIGVEEAASGTAVECGFMGCRCKSFRTKGDTGKFCACGHKRSLHAVADDKSQITSTPCYWECSSSAKDLTRADSALSSSGLNFVKCNDEVVAAVQQMATKSLKQSWTRDRGREADGTAKHVPRSYEVVHVQRAENLKIWRKYVLKRMLIKEGLSVEGGDTPPFEQFSVKTDIGAIPFMGADKLDPACNEWFLWHGSSLAGARNICETDFKQSLAGTTTGTLYGPGTYFAESFTKADEYGKCSDDGENEGLYTMLLVRIVGGRVKYTDIAEPVAADLTSDVLHGSYDSVLGDREKCRNTFKEFVIFGSDQAYPEFIVSYKRVD